jgi:WD40 repeat protein
VTGGKDRTLRVWSATTDTAASELLRSDGVVVNSKASNTDGSRVVSGKDVETVRIWDAVSGVVVGKRRKEHEGNVDSWL